VPVFFFPPPFPLGRVATPVSHYRNAVIWKSAEKVDIYVARAKSHASTIKPSARSIALLARFFKRRLGLFLRFLPVSLIYVPFGSF
jgi:hypothetical protein